MVMADLQTDHPRCDGGAGGTGDDDGGGDDGDDDDDDDGGGGDDDDDDGDVCSSLCLLDRGGPPSAKLGEPPACVEAGATASTRCAGPPQPRWAI